MTFFTRATTRPAWLPPALVAVLALGAAMTVVEPSPTSQLALVAAHASPGPNATASPQPTASPAPPMSGPPPSPECSIAQIRLDTNPITATGSTTALISGSPGQGFRVFAYTRPSTTYELARQGQLDNNGEATFALAPPANTRLYAQQAGCPAGPSVVLNVRTALSMFATRNSPRDYTFFGDSLPARPGGLVISLYRHTADGRRILTAQARADAGTGEYSIRRQFQGQGRFGFLVATGQDLRNAPGASNTRSTLIY